MNSLKTFTEKVLNNCQIPLTTRLYELWTELKFRPFFCAIAGS